MKGNANTSREISILSPVKDKHLLSVDKCFKFYRRFAILSIDYKLINSHTQILLVVLVMNCKYTEGTTDT